MHMKKPAAFTLIELLVVITIIISLLAMLLPSFHKSLDTADTVACQSNLKQLAVAYHSYAIENIGALMGGVPSNATDAFVQPGGGYDPIRNGALYPYIEIVSLYQCPADPNGNERSYVIPGVLRGEGWTGGSQQGTDRMSGVANMGQQIVFMEESDHRGWNVGSWLIPTQDGAEYSWIDYVGLFHDGQRADDFAYLDGHVERRVWEDPDTVSAGLNRNFYLSDPGSVDWDWIRPRYRAQPTRGSCRYLKAY